MNRRLKRLVSAAVFAALLAVLSMLVVPLPAGVPITLQTFGVALCGFCLGRKRGLGAVAAYLAVGACGLPVFAGFGGGIGWLIGPSGGFLWGFLPMVCFCGAAKGTFWKKIAIGTAGLFVCSLMGIAQYALVANVTLWQAFLVSCAPFLVKDLTGVFGALLLSVRLPKKIFQ